TIALAQWAAPPQKPWTRTIAGVSGILLSRQTALHATRPLDETPFKAPRSLDLVLWRKARRSI
ncbi:hypothetical protein, partial [Staphylococcus aureus]|uniref:hypothetical protein n=1 Tax=Staphylococcus aureus TaxID=1280 RepID=UPI0038B380E2